MTGSTAVQAALGEVFSLEGKSAVVTGAGSGLAETVAKTYARAGASVLVAHDDRAEADRVAAEITAAGGSATAATCDVTDEASVVALFADAPAPDIVFLGAMMQYGVPAIDMSAEQWDGMHVRNARGAFLTAREALRRMVPAGKGGSITGLSTIGSEHPVLVGNAAYGSSKAALNQLCRQLAFEHVADRIRVNVILPGAVPGNAPGMPGYDKYERKGPGVHPERHPSGMGEQVDVGWLAVYLASPAARYVTGQTFVIDGGFQVA